jgi:hypothetical protein
VIAALAQKDLKLAGEFMAREEAATIFSRYSDEMDAEIKSDVVKAALYCLYRDSGVDERISAMTACRRAPGATNVDRNFSEHARHRMYGANMEKIVNVAQKAGVRTQGKFYVGGLGRYTDQSAWVSTADDVLTVARQKNLNVSGAVNQDAPRRDLPPPPKVPMARDILDGYVRQYVRNDPALQEKVHKRPEQALPELREKILDKHTRKKKS